MADPILDVRLVVATFRNDGRATFNQVVMHQDSAPAGVLLVGIDPNAGLHLWLKPHTLIAGIAKRQAGKYSSYLSINLSAPPPALGDSVFIDKAKLPAHLRLGGARTNTLHNAVRKMLGV
jgi:hypothetical protein